MDFIEKTVRQVESKREQFSHIDESELDQRRGFVSSTRQTLASVRDTLESPATRNKMERDESEARKKRMASAKLQGKNPYQAENEHFIQDEQQTQQMLMRKQDENLGRLNEGVSRVNEMANNFNVEIQEQNKMLDEMDDDLDKVTEKMNVVMGSLSKLLKTKGELDVASGEWCTRSATLIACLCSLLPPADKCQLWGVIILFLILVILVGLVIYT